MADDERQCPVCSAIFATDAALGSPAFTDRATTSITVILMDSATTESFSATRNASPACISGPSVKAKPIT